MPNSAFGILSFGLVWSLLLSVHSSDAKLVQGKIKLSSQYSEQYLSKFSFSVGKGFIEGNFSANGVYFDHFRHDLRIYLFSDVGIAKYNALYKRGSLCRERMAEASWSSKIAPERNAANQFFSFTTEVNVVGRTYYWYAIVADCWLEEYDSHPPEFEYTLTFLNENHGHIPADERGMLTLHTVLFMGMVAFATYFAALLLAEFRKSNIVHLVTILVLTAYALQLVSVLFELCHLYSYSKNGLGLRWPHTFLALDQGSSVFQTFSELIISFLLISVACGWTLSQSVSLESGSGGTVNFNAAKRSFMESLMFSLQNPRYIFSRVGPASLFFPVLAFITLWLELWSHRYADDFNQFHDFEHTPGFVLIVLRATLCLIFLRGISSTLSSTPHVQLVSFLGRLRIVGLIWFLAFPCLVLGTFVFPPYMRHQLVTLASLTLQIGALCVMVLEILSNGEYFRLSSLSHPTPVASAPIPVSQPAPFAAPVAKRTKLAVD